MSFLTLAAVVSGCVLVWAVEKSWAIGVHASDTGGNGGVDQVLWVWLFLAFIGTVASVLALIIITSRVRSQR
jgi:hypothetical protein